MNKFQELYLNKVNGNISKYEEALKRMKKRDLILYTRYLFDEVVCDGKLPSEIFHEYIEKYLV